VNPHVRAFTDDEGEIGWWCEACDEEDRGYATEAAARRMGKDHDCDEETL